MSEKDPPSITLTRTIYDPAIKDFIISTPDAKALPHIKQWINQHNPVIYWYILRLDNPSDSDISQWAVELYAHRALTITEVYIDDSARRFELEKERHDPWTKMYVLAIPRQIGIPIVGKGTRRIFFKVDIDCKEGLMHEYGISGAFMAQGMGTVEIKEKMFQYSCKVGEFRQIFDSNPDEASMYAEKRLVGKYSSNSVQVFTNSFRMIHELYGYCHSGSLNRDDLLQKLHLLYISFQGVPEIAGERITPLIYDGIRELDVIVDEDKFTPRFMKLCDALVELLHIEVMDAEVKDELAFVPPVESPEVNMARTEPNSIIGLNNMCPNCGNIIDSSNKSLICKECRTRFCITCEEWFREERKRGQKPLCEDCFTAEQEHITEEKRHREEQERFQKEKEEQAKKEQEPKLNVEEEQLECGSKEKEEQEKRLKVEQEKKAREKAERKKHEEQRKQSEAEELQEKVKENSIGMKFSYIPAGEFMMGSEDEFDNEKPVHKVTISKPFYLGTYSVTQCEWRAVMGDNPSNFEGDDLPVENVSWDDVQEFIRKLNEKEGTDKYRLPSEAEWEYACRAGTTTRYCFGDAKSDLGDYAWYGVKNFFLFFKPHPVGQKKPNPWGLYDMHGNVWEWVQDEWHNDYDGAPIDGSSWESGDGSSQVIRGGGWYEFAGSCRSASRYNNAPGDRNRERGFRLLQDL